MGQLEEENPINKSQSMYQVSFFLTIHGLCFIWYFIIGVKSSSFDLFGCFFVVFSFSYMTIGGCW